ncbi:MAG: hypothetical protein JSU94_03075 [Phycisphaerales bacterium]|nr:MAG: hypothetical protein JSU94_03075 [Phycisphaerales bacterium]
MLFIPEHGAASHNKSPAGAVTAVSILEELPCNSLLGIPRAHRQYGGAPLKSLGKSSWDIAKPVSS